ncbi:MAG: hypothetical protein HQM15_08350 [Deltaproteobacteria bacterium]|nr:hypothetical protein [Deltaproteobacteria bacterium]
MCRLHRRYLTICNKRENNKHRALAALAAQDKKRAHETVAHEEKKKRLKGVGLAAAAGAVVGYGSVTLIGGVIAAHAIVAPFVVGMTVAGTGIGAAVKLTHSVKSRGTGRVSESRRLSSVFGNY